MEASSHTQVSQVSGAVSGDAVHGAAVGAAVGLLGIGLAVTAPVRGTALSLGGSIAASDVAIQSLFE